MAIFERNGRNIGYTQVGEGPALLTFHGTTQAGNAWDQVRDACPSEFTWVSFELPGSGESSMPTKPIELHDVVDDALALMTHLGHTTFHVAGYSLGAVTALYTAAHASDRVLTVTSLCGWATSDARMRLTFDLWRRLIAIGPDVFMRYALVDGYTAATLSLLEPMAETVIEMASAMIQPGSDAHLELDTRVDIDKDLELITAPALILGGTEDRWVDISHSRHLAKSIQQSQLVELPAGHLVIGELAGEIGRLIAQHATSH